ncbi:MAG: cell wall-binding repeat-containing protein [Nanoarchaeota archaeon]|nr:cell wall-binding repeat-containing protein [Nanoarchaeota archaeon]
MKRTIITIMMLMVLINVAYAADNQVVINSAKWGDVYSGMVYAVLEDNDPSFLTNKEYSTFIHKTLDKDKGVILIESAKNSFVSDFDVTLESKKLDVVEKIEADNINLELAKKLETNKFIIVDSAYGYDAVSVAPYAILIDNYVLLANRDTQDDILEFLSENNPKSIIVYGSVSKSFRDQLSKYNPEIIDKGGKFDNNLEIVSKFLEEKTTKQVTLTNGKFLEKGLFNKEYPTLFIGLKETPEEVVKFTKDNNIKTAVVVGNELITSAREFKQKVGLSSVLVKYAQGVPSEDAFAPVVALDMFFVPEPEMKLGIIGLTYNTASKNLEVQYKNLGARAYFKSSVSIYTEGELKETVGDNEASLIESDEVIGKVYSVDLIESIANSENITASLLVLLGPERTSLENTLSKDFSSIDMTEIEDNAEVELESLQYNKKTKELIVNVENTGDVDAYVKAEVSIIVLNVYGEEENIVFANKEPILVKENSKSKVILKAVLDPSTIIKTSVELQYGVRENVLIKSDLTEDVNIKQTSGVNVIVVAIIAVVFVVMAIVIIALMSNKGKNKK